MGFNKKLSPSKRWNFWGKNSLLNFHGWLKNNRRQGHWAVNRRARYVGWPLPLLRRKREPRFPTEPLSRGNSCGKMADPTTQWLGSFNRGRGWKTHPPGGKRGKIREKRESWRSFLQKKSHLGILEVKQVFLKSVQHVYVLRICNTSKSSISPSWISAQRLI